MKPINRIAFTTHGLNSVEKLDQIIEMLGGPECQLDQSVEMLCGECNSIRLFIHLDITRVASKHH